MRSSLETPESVSAWGRLSPLPGVHARYRAEHSFEDVRDRYHDLPKSPFVVRGSLLTPYVPAEPDGTIHLDSVLGSMVLDSHPKAPLFPENGSPVTVPLPVELAWVSPEGLPLWALSDLRPQGDAIRSQEYWHKRAPSDRMDLANKQRLEARRGRWKEYRIPLSTIRVPEIRAVGVGDPIEVARLLSHVSHVGKKASQGFGRVEWSVVPWDVPTEDAQKAALMARPVPARYLFEAEGEINLSEGTNYTRRSFCPPHWYAPWWDLAVVRA